jgi:hypothetical protein
MAFLRRSAEESVGSMHTKWQLLQTSGMIALGYFAHHPFYAHCFAATNGLPINLFASAFVLKKKVALGKYNLIDH